MSKEEESRCETQGEILAEAIITAALAATPETLTEIKTVIWQIKVVRDFLKELRDKKK